MQALLRKRSIIKVHVLFSGYHIAAELRLPCELVSVFFTIMYTYAYIYININDLQVATLVE